MRFKIILYITICFICTDGYTQQDSLKVAQTDSLWLVKSFLQDEGRLWSSPFHMKPKNILFWIPVLSITAVSINFDEDIYYDFKMYQENHYWVDEVSPVITLGGDGTVDMGICTGIYLGGIVFKNNKAVQTGMLAAQALAHAGLIVTVGKELTSRKRPHGADASENGLDNWHWFPAGMKEFTMGAQRREYDAFPSGHSISIWSIATVIAGQYRDHIWVPILSYSVATGVGLSRITEDAHWLSDVIVGSALGYTIGKNMLRSRKRTRWLLFPSSWQHQVVLTGIYTF